MVMEKKALNGFNLAKEIIEALQYIASNI